MSDDHPGFHGGDDLGAHLGPLIAYNADSDLLIAPRRSRLKACQLYEAPFISGVYRAFRGAWR